MTLPPGFPCYGPTDRRSVFSLLPPVGNLFIGVDVCVLSNRPFRATDHTTGKLISFVDPHWTTWIIDQRTEESVFLARIVFDLIPSSLGLLVTVSFG